MALKWRRILLGPERLTIWHHLAIALTWGIFCFGFGGVTKITLTALPLLYLLVVGGFYLTKGLERAMPRLWKKLLKK